MRGLSLLPSTAGRRPIDESMAVARISANVIVSVLAGVVAWVAFRPVQASDPENCLMCHRYPGLSRISDDGDRVESYHVEASYYDHLMGAHSRLKCTDCHLRREVEVVPHRPISAVDCSRACHIALPGRPELEFSHAPIADLLAGSVHTQNVLDDCNRLLGSPLKDGQSRCLLCHDEPRYRRGDEPWFLEQGSLARCSSCHTQELWVDTSFAFWHVHARSHPARTHKDVARMCALCHSNEQVRQAYALPDATASYLASFHGKAMLLGSEATAGCLDCHAAAPHNVHDILARTNPDSPAFEGHLPDTCRSAACHPGAGERISSAAIHLELRPSQPTRPSSLTTAQPALPQPTQSHTIELLIATFFVFLILFTFGPSLVLQALELLQVICGRHDPEHHQRHELARRLVAEDATRRALHRFTVHQRVQHWFLVVCFVALAVTGFPIKFADRDWARWVVDSLGGLAVTRQIHRWAGSLLVLGAVYHLIYVTRGVIRTLRSNKKGLWPTILDLPMVMKRQELHKFFQLLGFLLFMRRSRPEFGRFGLREKFEYFGVFWGCTILGVTGLMLWEHALTTRYVTGRVLTIASLVHTLEAFLALLHVGVIHLIGVIFAPQVFPMSMAMFTGDTPSEELAESHSEMLAAAQQRGPA